MVSTGVGRCALVRVALAKSNSVSGMQRIAKPILAQGIETACQQGEEGIDRNIPGSGCRGLPDKGEYFRRN